jgi:NTE family protein
MHHYRTYMLSLARYRLAILIVVSFLILISGENVRANQSTLPTRPHIGLVLSGGGARGCAHIGVLKILEEMRIPIDYIAGTSMGAIVGGLYASGVSPANLEKLVTSIDWNEAFTDKPPTDEMAFRRKEDSQSYKIDIDLGYGNGKFAIPKGLVQGQNLNVLLKRLFIHTSDINDFNQLHIPFRALAADIETGEPVVIGMGDLATAVRASMSIPGAFAPIEIGGRMLVDGGIANNLPVNIVRQMGADILIVVNIGTPLRIRDDLTSTGSITSQIITLLIQNNVQAQLKTLNPGDILIQPELGSLGTTDFSQATRAMSIGEAAAQKLKNELANLSVSPEIFKTYLAHQRQMPVEAPRIEYVKVEGQSKLSPKVLESQIETKPGEKLELDKLTQDLRRLYGLNMFERVDFRLEKTDDGTGLVFKPIDKSWGPTHIKFGIGLTDDFKGASNYSISASITQMAMNALGGEWRTEFQIGESPRFYTEFFQPIDYSNRFFLLPMLEFRQRTINVFDGSGNTLAEYLVNTAQVGLLAGRQFGNWGTFRFGPWWTYGKASVNIGNPSMDSGGFKRGGWLTDFHYNTLDDFNFPSKGTTVDAVLLNNLQEFGAENRADGLTLALNTVITWGKYTFIPGIHYSGYFSSDSKIEDSYNMGGFFNLSGYLPNQLSGQHTGLARVIFYRKMGSVGLGNFRTQLYLGASAEAGNVWAKSQDITMKSLIYAGSVFISANTFLGPVYLGYGMAERGHQSIGLYIGQRF